MNNTNGSENNNVDIRIIRLGKWQIPRTEEIQKGDKHTYLSIGYFDLIHIIKGTEINYPHLFMNAYMSLPKQKKYEPQNIGDLSKGYTVQELIGYTNIGKNGFKRKYIRKFWADRSFLLFVSLINIDSDNNVADILRRIRQIFDGKKYLYYFSFDYSGIILFFKGQSIKEYLELLFRLNYEKDGRGRKLIRDSYSFYGFQCKQVVEYFAEFRAVQLSSEAISLESELEKTNDSEKVKELKTKLRGVLYDRVNVPLAEEQFSTTINIGVQNFETYKKFLKKVDKIEPDHSYRKYGMLGRHDISIVKDNATLKWLVYVQYILNELIEELLDKQKGSGSYDILFSVHETFGKIEDFEEYDDTEISVENKIYNFAVDDLEKICGDFEKELTNAMKETAAQKKGSYNGQYLSAIQSVKYSLLSILKNRYAEDFVLCIYRPFKGYLRYLTRKIIEEKGNPHPELFDECYKNFFACLDSLVNSAMHSERQFIQATAFNAVIYDVPVKLLSFYMAIIDDIKTIMKCDEEKEENEYTIILTPSFSNEIQVKVISYNDEHELPLPHARLLKVEINEKSLYNPSEVVRTMVHEIGHFLGEEIRKRDVRRKRVIFSIVLVVLAHIFSKDFTSSTYGVCKLAEDISEYLMGIRGFLKSQCSYSRELKLLGKRIAYEFKTNSVLEQKLREFVKNTLTNSNNIEDSTYLKEVVRRRSGDSVVINDYQILTDMVMDEIMESIQYLDVERVARLVRTGEIESSINVDNKNKNLNEVTLTRVTDCIVRMYCEAYADIQKVIITGIGYQDYLMGFLGGLNENWEFSTEENVEDMGRIAMTAMALEKCGLWKYEKEYPVCGALDKKLGRVNDSVQRIIGCVNRIQKSEEKFRKFREEYAEAIEELSHKKKTPDLKEQNLCFNDVETDQKDISFLTARLYLELLRYLYNCTVESVKEYSKTDKMKKILALRDTMQLVNECRDIQVVFEEMNRKIKEYRDKVFQLENDKEEGTWEK